MRFVAGLFLVGSHRFAVGRHELLGRLDHVGRHLVVMVVHRALDRIEEANRWICPSFAHGVEYSPAIRAAQICIGDASHEFPEHEQKADDKERVVTQFQNWMFAEEWRFKRAEAELVVNEQLIESIEIDFWFVSISHRLQVSVSQFLATHLLGDDVRAEFVLDG